MRALFRIVAGALFVAVVVQIALAAYGGFHAVHAADHASISKHTINNGFGAHIALGYIIVIVMIALLLIAVAGRLGQSSIRWSAAILVLGVLQAILGSVSESVPAIGPLHGLNALAIFAATGLLAHRSWTAMNQPASPTEPEAVAGT